MTLIGTSAASVAAAVLTSFFIFSDDLSAFPSWCVLCAGLAEFMLVVGVEA